MNKLLISIIFILFQISATSQVDISENKVVQTLDDTVNNSLFGNDKAIEKWLEINKVSALGIGIISEGKLTQIKVYGELKKDVTAPFNSIFNVASLTKPIVSMLTLKLVSSGKLKLDEPLYKY